MKELGTVGLVGRFKPLHNGGAAMLESICDNADHVLIGIGSSNKYNSRNPFTAEESRGMIDAYLSQRFSNYSFIEVPDFAHIPEYSDGQKWKEYVVGHFGKLDYFVSGNSYVSELLQDKYRIIHTAEKIPSEKRTCLRATTVRMEMAKGCDWKRLVPKEVADYLEKNGLVERFRREFGLETIAELSGTEYLKHETALDEKVHATER